MSIRLRPLVMLIVLFAMTACAQDAPLKTMFRVKYVAEGTVYLEGGRNAGLAEGMKLTIKRSASIATESGNGEATGSWIIGELTVISVADSSAVCDVRKIHHEIKPGDVAYLNKEEVEALVEKRALGNTRTYPMVVSFTEGDPLDEDVRASVPKPPLPEVNRARGRIGVDYNSMTSNSGGQSSYSQLGFVVRADITRIGGSYWNVSGYWRGRFNSRNSSAQTQSVQDLINRTYHLELTYANPNSRWTVGFGRLYLPWASSLDTIDGGYVGRRIGGHTTVGAFAGTTPDPTSWNYNPDRQLAGTFVALEGGSFDSVKFNSTVGVGISSLQWRIDRPFLFTENGIFYKHVLSIYHSLQADEPKSSDGTTRLDAGISRSYLTVRLQPVRWLAFDVNHNYFRDIPTYDPRLVSTGLIDKLLFQGVSGGVRVELPEHVSLYTNIGRSNRTGDAKESWNALYGVTVGRLWRTGLRVDARYSQFDSSFGSGWYQSLGISRNITDGMRWEIQGGRQRYASPLSIDNGSLFMNSMVDLSLGPSYFMEAGFNMQRGQLQDYDQWYTTFGYRFDNRRKRNAP